MGAGMSKPIIKETHVRTCRVVIERKDLEKLVKDHAMALAGFLPFATTAKVSFPDATEGSPPYRVGTYCTVDLEEDQMQIPRAEEQK